ncbi:hypothetical protein FAZ78_19755 [Cereibacter changlensis]|uniref:Pepco domain-containing protein n=1 Tax=Cereibacter changlensis TaxID=402884 RepID=A0A4U0YT38_9RHOB|nr:hypothetical protein [Cereibacter changlensis]TKA94895.1 hypothetical protein FAZ78_19755 [Cereibacter changlensis]
MAEIWVYEKDDPLTRGADNWRTIDSELLSKELSALIRSVVPAVDSIPPKTGQMQVSEIELSLTVSASGRVGFIGSGVEAGAEASIKVVLKRTP